eukprot:TRINITY_DN7552_c0_g2_i1.p1 TRINITY_DN7552_c0_g2~~TRINITY_DN7552_c0_g2_i1.p1  ORF type:complete len:406 (-),score=60.16 TRINITY_DN7552_c0_g2_i1:245-1336(-)
MGDGGAGSVYRAIDVASLSTKGRSSREVAVKIYRDKGKFNREVRALQRVSGHPNVVELLTSHIEATQAIVMPLYSGGELHAYVWKCDGLSEIKAASVTSDLLSALQHVHGLDIIHSDVKPENVCLGQNGRAVLTDFDIACTSFEALARTPRGTPGYMAPEIIKGKPCSVLSDVFAVGCVVYFMFAKIHPFRTKSMSNQSIMDKTVECNLKFGSRFHGLSLDCIAFVSSTVLREPERRLSEQKASAHPWLHQEETAERVEQDDYENHASEAALGTSTIDLTLGLVASMNFENIDLPETVHGTGRNSDAKSYLSRVKSVGRTMFGKFSRAVYGMRKKQSRVTRVGSTYENPTQVVPSSIDVSTDD